MKSLREKQEFLKEKYFNNATKNKKKIKIKMALTHANTETAISVWYNFSDIMTLRLERNTKMDS